MVMKNRQLLVYIGVILLFCSGAIYCSEQVPVDAGKSEKRGIKRSASKKLLSGGPRRKKSKKLKAEKKAIITYKHLHCYEPKGQMRFSEQCEKNGWVKDETLKGFTYAKPEGYDYCPLREKSNCPYLIIKQSTHNALQQHMRERHKAEYNDVELKAKYAALHVVASKKKIICFVCNGEFANQRRLNTHFKECSHGNACPVCNKQFKNSRGLATHFGLMHRKTEDQVQISQPLQLAAAEAQQPPLYAQAAEGVPEYPFAVPSFGSEPKGPIRGGGDPMFVIDGTGE